MGKCTSPMSCIDSKGDYLHISGVTNTNYGKNIYNPVGVSPTSKRVISLHDLVRIPGMIGFNDWVPYGGADIERSWIGRCHSGAGSSMPCYGIMANNQYLHISGATNAGFGNKRVVGLFEHLSMPDPSSQVLIRTDVPNPSFALTVNGDVKIMGDSTGNSFFASSDRRLKTDIYPLENTLEKVQKLLGVNFKWRKNNQKDIGVIAQEVEKIYPELVKTDTTGKKSVAYGHLAPILIEAIKELNQKVNNLELELDHRLKKIEDKLKRIKE